MAEPVTASPPSPVTLPPPPPLDPSEGKNKASPDDFLSPPSNRDALLRSGDSPPPPERKQYDRHAASGGGGSSSSSSSCPPPSERKQFSSSSDGPGPPPPPGSSGAPKQRRDRYGLGGSSNTGPMKFQFYVPSSRPSPQEGGGGGGGPPMDSEGGPARGSGRSGGGSAPDLQRIIEGGGGSGRGGGGGGHKGKQAAGGGGNKKGIDPPEKEPPTAIVPPPPMTAEESARKVRSRLIQLQHRESHATGPPSRDRRGEPPTSAPPNNANAAPQGKGRDSGGGRGDGSVSSDSSSSRPSGRRSRAGTGSSFGGLVSIDAKNEDDDEDDDYPHVNMDPIESDDEDPVSDHFDDQGARNDAGLKPSYQSPIRTSNAGDQQQSYMKKHPSSAPQRPSHRMPPPQLMQYLHAGRGSFGRQHGGGPLPGGGGGGGMGNTFPVPPYINNGGLSNYQPPQQQHNQQHPSRHSQFDQQPHYHQQHQQQLRQQHHRNYNQPVRRKSDLYSDGINLLEKAASEAREREEVDTLNDGINYLRTALEKGDRDGGPSGTQYLMPPPPHMSSSLNMGPGGGMMGGMMSEQRPGGNIGGGISGGFMGMPMESQSPRKANVPAPPPPFPPPPPLTNRPHRPPPKAKNFGGQEQQAQRTRSSSAGDDMERSAQIDAAQRQQQQQQHQHGGEGQHGGHQGGHQRVHRPPPPRQPLSVPTTPTQIRKRPVITVAAAMDYVMSASSRPLYGYESDASAGGDGDREDDGGGDPGQVAADMNKMHTFLDAMIREDGEDTVSVGVSGRDTELQSPRAKKTGSFDSIEGGSDDSQSSSAVSVASQEVDDFERSTSLSMHAEAKFGSGQYVVGSRYAEDKHGMSDSILHRMERLSLDDKNGDTPQRTRSHNERQRSMDPPVDDSDDDSLNIGIGDGQEPNNDSIVSPSVLPMRTMNEHLYAVEAVIPTPTRYHHHQELFADEVDSFDRVMPRLVAHEDAARVDSLGAMHSPQPSSHALGPRSQRPGGITGVVLDMGLEGKDIDSGGEFSAQRPSSMERERLRPEPSSSSSVSSGDVSVSSSEESKSSESDDDHDPQDSLADDPPREGMAHGDLDEYAWNVMRCVGESSPGMDEGVGGSSSSQHPSMSLMLNLCSHLLPALDDSNSLAFLQNNKSNSHHLAWDDDDPDEPGYIVHHLTNAQLASVENAFEKMVNLLDLRSSEKLNGSNKNFERDLEEAEQVLDQEEKRYESEAVEVRSGEEDSYVDKSGEEGNESETKLQETEAQRECVPDFPGIYPPGKGKAGEMECFYLPIITKSQKTGFEPTKDLVLKSGSVFANNYLVQSELGSAAFSTAYRCLDLSSEEDEDGYQDEVCLKVIKNTKDYFDQSLDEIKILQLLKDTGRVQENNIVEMKSFFYHREHLVIVTELLRQNLYEFGKSILESRGPLYFTRLRLSHITRQCLVALKFVHDLGLMHCDIKPENILLSSYSRALVKVIDFGSSSFITDRQSSYIQSRSYRAPEVILGLPYGGEIDMWSLGCVVAEMYTNEVTFQNDSELSMLSRIEAICGPFPRHMIAKGRNSHRIFTDSGLIYEKVSGDEAEEEGSRDSSDDDSEKTLFNVYQPKMTTIAARLGFDEDFMDQRRLSEDDEKRALFVDFVSKLLTIDPDSRLSAAEALNHPWITSSLDLMENDIRYGQ